MKDFDGEKPVWLSYHLYVGRYFDLMDDLIVDGVGTVAAEVDPLKWFYIRYTDQNGPHIRFRVLVDAGRADSVDHHIMRAATQALDKLAEYPPSGRTSLVTVEQFEAQLDSLTNWSTPVEVHRIAYEPEVDVYGLPGAGLPIAEEAFWRSSELAVEILSQDRDGSAGLKKTLATCLADRLIRTFKPDQGRQKFLKMYSSYWLAATGLEHVFHERVAIKLEDIRRQGIVVLPNRNDLSPAGQSILAQWERLLRHADQRYGAETVDYQRTQKQKLTFNLLHLMNNRLGFGPLDEAYICALLMSTEPALEPA